MQGVACNGLLLERLHAFDIRDGYSGASHDAWMFVQSAVLTKCFLSAGWLEAQGVSGRAGGSQAGEGKGLLPCKEKADSHEGSSCSSGLILRRHWITRCHFHH